jgi:hypothetical protein
MVHVSDFHADPWYEKGAIANCAGKYCCRSNSVAGTAEPKYAGMFGTNDGPCDIPMITVSNTLDYI